MKKTLLLLAWTIHLSNGMDPFMQKKIEEFRQDDLEQERLTAKLEYHTMALEDSMHKMKRNFAIQAMVDTIIECVRYKKKWSAQEIENLFDTLLVPKFPDATIEENVARFISYNEQTDLLLNDGEHWYTC